jgi:glycosyltransferase involved in cell wall biosynthesis
MKLAVVITARNEGTMLRTSATTALAGYAASRYALHWADSKQHGLDLVIVLDKADETTTRVAHALADDIAALPHHDEIQLIVVATSYGEPGSARNDGVKATQADLIALLDADDLFGKQFLACGAGRFATQAAASRLGDLRMALQPEFLFYFGLKSLFWRQPSYFEYSQFPQALYRNNLWDVTVLTTRHVLLVTPFVRAMVREGAGYEDREWALTTTNRGVQHDILSGNFCYKRTKADGRFANDTIHAMLIPSQRLTRRIFKKQTEEQPN